MLTTISLTSEYTGLPMMFLKLYGANGFFLSLQLLVKASGSGSYLHIEVCEISIYPTEWRDDCQSVKRTLDPLAQLGSTRGCKSSSAYIIMSEKFLNRSDMIFILQQMGRERMA